MFPDDDRSLSEIAEENPGEFLVAVRTMLGDESIGREAVKEIAVRMAVHEGINLFRVFRENSEHVEEIWGEPMTVSDEVVAVLDEAIEDSP